jgi:hypothetical protein
LFLTKQPGFISSLAALRFLVAKNDNKLAGGPGNNKVFFELFSGTPWMTFFEGSEAACSESLFSMFHWRF